MRAERGSKGGCATLLVVLIAMAAGAYWVARHSVVLADEGVVVVGKRYLRFADSFVDIRAWSPEDFEAHEHLRGALVAAGHKSLVKAHPGVAERVKRRVRRMLPGEDPQPVLSEDRVVEVTRALNELAAETDAAAQDALRKIDELRAEWEASGHRVREKIDALMVAGRADTNAPVAEPPPPGGPVGDE